MGSVLQANVHTPKICCVFLTSSPSQITVSVCQNVCSKIKSDIVLKVQTFFNEFPCSVALISSS